MIWSRIILLTLAALLTWPPGLLSPPVDRLATNGSLPAHAAPATTGAGEVAETPARARQQRPDRKRVSGKNTRQKDARKDKNTKKSQNKHKHTKDRKRKGRKRQEKGAASGEITQAEIEELVATAPPKLPALSASDNPCGPGMIQLPKSGRCTHGPDDLPPAPPARAPLAERDARRETVASECDGDGTSGFRIQVLYTRSTALSNRFSASLDDIRDAAAGADAILRDSSLAAGAADAMGFHFVQNEACDIDVLNVPLSPAAMLSFDTTIIELQRLGFDRIDRIYLIFADTTSAGICGIGTQWPDDRATPNNSSNRGPSFARADFFCWDGHTAAHELRHTLGAVQDSAPNSSLGGHCIDEYDVMCYSDEPFEPEMEIVCTPAGAFENRFDCGNDDYFDPVAPFTSYLATHWNTANNWFLTQDIPPGTDLDPPVVEWTTPTGNDQTYEASSGTIPLAAHAEDDSGIAFVEFWLFDAQDDEWTLISEDDTAPYTSSISVTRLRSGLNYLTADAYDDSENWTDEGIWINRTTGQPNPPIPPNPAPPAATPPGITLQTSSANVKKQQAVTLTAAVSNAVASDVAVEFRLCRGLSCTWEAGESLGSAPGTAPSMVWPASGKGAVTFLATITGPTGSSRSNPIVVIVKDKKGKKKR